MRITRISNRVQQLFKVQSSCRYFSATGQRNGDLVKDLYLNEIKSYKAPPAEKIDLPTTFAAPKAPAKPEVEQLAAVAAEEAALAEEAWPALVDPIDDPTLYNDEYDISTENDDGSLFPKRLKPFDYDHGH